jgi:hypothetical protein
MREPGGGVAGSVLNNCLLTGIRLYLMAAER